MFTITLQNPQNINHKEMLSLWCATYDLYLLEHVNVVLLTDLSVVLENLLFLSDFVLRLPDTTRSILKKLPGSVSTIGAMMSSHGSTKILEPTDLLAINLVCIIVLVHCKLSFLPAIRVWLVFASVAV